MPPPPPRRGRSRSRSMDRNQKKTSVQSPYRDRPKTRAPPTPSPSSKRNSTGWPADVKMPTDFQPDADHYDVRNQYKMAYPKKVVESPWTKKQGFAGMNVFAIPLHAVLKDGPADYAMRLLANGRYTNFEVCKSFKESIFIQALLKELRQRDPNNPALPVIDLDGITANIAKEKSLPNNTGVEKKHVMNILAKKVANYIKDMNPINNESEILKQLEELKKENAKLRLNKNTMPVQDKRAKTSASKKEAKKPLPTEDEDDQEEPEPQANQEEQQGDQEDEQDDSEDALINFRRGPKQSKFLQTNAPTTTGKSAMTKFTDHKNLGITLAKHKTMMTNIQSRKGEFEDLPVQERGQLPAIAVDWGLPVSVAAKLNHQELVTTIAVAQFMAK